MDFLIWYTLCHLQLHGPALAMQVSLAKALSVRGLLRLVCLHSTDEIEKTNAANRVLETLAWVAEQTIQYRTNVIGLKIIFPEDLGGHIAHGPTSLWALREFQLLEGTREVPAHWGRSQAPYGSALDTFPPTKQVVSGLAHLGEVPRQFSKKRTTTSSVILWARTFFSDRAV